MKFAKSLLIGLLLSTVWMACKKDNDAPVFSIQGEWAGKIGTGVAAPSGQFALSIQGGGVIKRISANGNASAIGTWQLNGDAFTATYTYTDDGTIVKITATVDKAKNKLTGNWENDGTGKGSFYASKN